MYPGSINVQCSPLLLPRLTFPTSCRHQHLSFSQRSPLSSHAHDQTSFQRAFILEQTLDSSSQPFFPLSDPPSSAINSHDEMATYK